MGQTMVVSNFIKIVFSLSPKRLGLRFGSFFISFSMSGRRQAVTRTGCFPVDPQGLLVDAISQYIDMCICTRPASRRFTVADPYGLFPGRSGTRQRRD
jgi:hypothetical protein